ncbi:hypothetical protein NMY22_g6735 [Coprinellus aureogranulatus]|nr:hypothetical protein NMY22_g6735 [Coprinellus aureogranulatus]
MNHAFEHKATFQGSPPHFMNAVGWVGPQEQKEAGSRRSTRRTETKRYQQRGLLKGLTKPKKAYPRSRNHKPLTGTALAEAVAERTSNVIREETDASTQGMLERYKCMPSLALMGSGSFMQHHSDEHLNPESAGRQAMLDPQTPRTGRRNKEAFRTLWRICNPEPSSSAQQPELAPQFSSHSNPGDALQSEATPLQVPAVSSNPHVANDESVPSGLQLLASEEDGKPHTTRRDTWTKSPRHLKASTSSDSLESFTTRGLVLEDAALGAEKVQESAPRPDSSISSPEDAAQSPLSESCATAEASNTTEGNIAVNVHARTSSGAEDDQEGPPRDQQELFVSQDERGKSRLALTGFTIDRTDTSGEAASLTLSGLTLLPKEGGLHEGFFLPLVQGPHRRWKSSKSISFSHERKEIQCRVKGETGQEVGYLFLDSHDLRTKGGKRMYYAMKDVV